MNNPYEHITRFEVIDENGRAYTHRTVKNLELSFQDDDRTLKVFLNQPMDLSEGE